MRCIETAGSFMIGNAFIYWLIVFKGLDTSKTTESTVYWIFGIGVALSIIGKMGSHVEDGD